VAIPLGIPGLECRVPGRVGLPGTLGMSVGLNGGEPARPPTPLAAVPRQNDKRLTHAQVFCCSPDGATYKQHKIRKRKNNIRILLHVPPLGGMP